MDTFESLLSRGQQANAAGGPQALMGAGEAEHIINQLQCFQVEDVGSARWLTQHDWLERLNLQAHHNAQSHSDEFVVELLVSLDKMKVLAHDLLVIEAWKAKVLPHLHRHLARSVDSVLSYVVLYHECAVANLLEVTLYHAHACEAVPEDYLLELADWCYRKLTYLNTDGRKHAEVKERTAQELIEASPEDDLQEKIEETAFGAAMCSLTILRYLTDGVTSLPLGLMGRLVSTNDTVMGLVPLLDDPPWVRRRRGKPLEKFVDNKWRPVEAADRIKLTQADAQVWLSLNNLIVDPKCRAKYSMDEYRRDKLLALKRFMNELLFDQMPVLKDLQRVLDELSLGLMHDSESAKTSALILEQVPVVRDALLRGRDWRAVALDQARTHFGEAAKKMAQERLESLMKAFEFMCDLEPAPAAAPAGAAPAAGGGAPGAAGADAAAASGPGPIKVSCWRKVHESGVMESWCDFSLDIDTSKPPENTTVGDIQALRYRLQSLDSETSRALPSNGKAAVRLSLGGGSSGLGAPLGGANATTAAAAGALLSAEALLQLPELPTRSSTEGAAALWVTVGLLATDGFALQLKLKKASKPRERDKVAGVWYAYHPVGGAITIARQQPQQQGQQQQQQQPGRLQAVAPAPAQQPQPKGLSPAGAAAAAAAAPKVQPLQAAAPTSSSSKGAAGGAPPAACSRPPEAAGSGQAAAAEQQLDSMPAATAPAAAPPTPNHAPDEYTDLDLPD